MRPLRLRREQTCQGPLVLIDRAHPLQEGAPPELVPVDRLHPQVLLERRAARLLAAWAERGVNTLQAAQAEMRLHQQRGLQRVQSEERYEPPVKFFRHQNDGGDAR